MKIKKKLKQYCPYNDIYIVFFGISKKNCIGRIPALKYSTKLLSLKWIFENDVALSYFIHVVLLDSLNFRVTKTIDY